MDLPQLPLITIAAPDQTRTAAGGAGPGAQAQAVAEQFEALFLSQMLAPMFESLQTDGPFGGGPGEGIYRSLMVEEYSKAIAQAGGLSIAESVQREILKMQEFET